MGQARLKGKTFEERKKKAIKEGRIKSKRLSKNEIRGILFEKMIREYIR